MLDNGIWFASGIAENFILNDNLMDIENAAYSTTERIGIYEKENKLYISSNETTFEKGNVNLEGHLYLLNTISNDASIHIGNMVIKEVNKNTSGINIL